LTNDYDIAIRSGLHCAPLMHIFLNTLDTGLIRASVSGLNTEEEAFTFLKAVREVIKD
jgi:selenocysteine lyase/cysteine desulfurase